MTAHQSTSTSPLEVHLTDADLAEALRADVHAGLTAHPKQLPPKWFYDARGSELFEQITTLPEYYPTRTEREILRQGAPAIAAAATPDVLVELGSGSSEKTRLLLDAMADTLTTYVPQDVSVSALTGAVDALAASHPGLRVRGMVSDFTDTLHHLPAGGRRMIAFLGGTIGNMIPAERAEFLASIAAALRPGETLLLGAGLVVPPAVVVPAYDDAAGVTAEFDRNVLRVVNARLHADFEPDAFRHVALWDAANEWIEMRLEATRAMRVTVADLNLAVDFAEGEQLRTEISAKFRLDGIARELADAGLTLVHTWTDDDHRFAVLLAERGRR
ncbi:L-histidine N(alpha)-methyltransferase [Tsukamurella soli]|uniref:Histidine N-alpha-methyltransferase n=1 Tax=Tsukamurella soli TaxID=644556 RepID=A0ABP8J1M2_9ACTN